MRHLIPVGDGHPAQDRNVVGEPAEPIGAEQGAGAEKAEHRADAQAMEQWHDHAGDRQEEDDLLVGVERDRCGHGVFRDSQNRFHDMESAPVLLAAFSSREPGPTHSKMLEDHAGFTPPAASRLDAERARWA